MEGIALGPGLLFRVTKIKALVVGIELILFFTTLAPIFQCLPPMTAQYL
jgi:hypothetical protein